MLQMLGACLVLLGCLGYGYGMIRRNKEVLRIMEIWECILQMFVSEIMYKKQALGYACYEIGGKVGGKEGELLQKISKRVNEKQSGHFYQIWEEECENYCKEVKIRARERELINEFGKMTGFEDGEVHKNMIGMQMEKWRNERVRKQEEFLERKKIILTLSSCIGMMIILILW